MATIVAFPVPSIDVGFEVLDQLDGFVTDAAMVYRNKHGRVKIQQTTDATVGKGVVRGGLLGGALSILTGPLVGMAVAGGALGAAYGALRDKGLSDKLMRLAGDDLPEGGAAIFILADDDLAAVIQEKAVEAGAAEVEVGSFPAEAADVVRDVLQLG